MQRLLNAWVDLFQGYKFEANRSLSLICNGNYPEIHILDPSRLEVIYSLVAQVHPDWINALCILKPVKREGKSGHNTVILHGQGLIWFD